MRRYWQRKSVRWTVVVLALLAVVGAATGSTKNKPNRHASLASASAIATAPTATTSPVVATSHAASPTRPNPKPKSKPQIRHTSVNGLAVSSARNDAVQAHPAPGTCHARGSGSFAEPDRRCTPGALNPAVTQRTIDRTICVSGWTKTVRPPESVTEREKVASMAAYGDSGSTHGYEYDHLVSLELGGATNDARNLWPEPGGSPNPKDSVENALHRQVCSGEMSLARAQHVIATDWVGWAHSHHAAATPSATNPVPAPSAPAPPSTAGSPAEHVVHPGAFCAPEGAQGVTDAGTPMTCKTSATDSRDRWRRS